MTKRNQENRRYGNMTFVLADAAAMSLRARGTELRSEAVANLAGWIADAGRWMFIRLRQSLCGCVKTACPGC